MKKTILTLFILAFVSIHSAYAISGDCAWHDGFACDKGADWDGSVICADGWRDSQDKFEEAQECQDLLVTYEDRLRHEWKTRSNYNFHYLVEKCSMLGIEYYSFYLNKSNEYRRIDPMDTADLEKCLEEQNQQEIDYNTFRPTYMDCVYETKTTNVDVLLDMIQADMGAFSDTISMCGDLQNGSGLFSDVEISNSHFDAINYVKSQGIVQGYDDGSFRPDQLINRAEFTKIITEAAFPDEMKFYSSTNFTFSSQCFNDVPTDKWFSLYVCTAKQKGIINGYSDGSFKPEKNIDNLEALKITIDAFYESIPDVGGEWYENYVKFANFKKLTPDEWIYLGQDITRGEMAELIYRILRDI